MAGIIYVDVGPSKIEVFFGTRDGLDSPCSYCGNPGYEKLVEIDMMFNGAYLLRRNSEMWQIAKEKAEQRLLQGQRSVCSMGREISPCRKLYRKEIREGE